MATCLIGLGSNLGEREQNLSRAIELLRANPDVRVERVSSNRATRPAGGPAGQGEFLNAAAVLETALEPPALLAVLHNIENELGRVRSEHWGERVVDLDLLLYDRLELKTPALELPHPRMSFRRFVLEPAAEIAPEMVYPINGWMIAELLANLNRPEKYIATQGASDATLQLLHRTGLVHMLHDLDFEGILKRELASGRKGFARGAHSQLVEWSRQRAAILDDCKGTDPNVWTVSDFWFETVTYLIDYLASTNLFDAAACHAALEPLRNNLVQPKLVVLIDFADYSLPLLSEMSQAYDALRHRSDTGPVLVLPAAEPEQCVAEVLAAMQAME